MTPRRPREPEHTDPPEEALLDALYVWLGRVSVPALLIPLLEGAVLGHHGEALARYLERSPEELPALEAAFASSAGRPLHWAATEIRNAARAAPPRDRSGRSEETAS
ncbi:MAG TPA: hypothetical protein RMH99_21620 [Sandaracinaceae bacterium LLY-WYZ-13_1]|nr:hypothetical protein [Sandaracinaceae bacterium LLY-WYZ-13_1]